MLGTELSCGVARHNPAARNTPATRSAAPVTRLMIAGQSAFCIVSTILIKHPHQELRVNERLVTGLAVEDQDRWGTRTLQGSLQGIARGSAKQQTALIELLTNNENK